MGVLAFAVVAAAHSSASPATIAARKATLLDAISHSRQGRDVSLRPRVEQLIEQLEEVNPNSQPVSQAPEKLTACWRLVYTTSNSILGVSRPRIFQPRPVILQQIDAFGLQAKNKEWICGGLVKNEVRAKLSPRDDGETVNVNFFQFRLGGIPVNVNPEKFAAFLRTTFVDDELRVSRGDKGNLFVLTRYGDVTAFR